MPFHRRLILMLLSALPAHANVVGNDTQNFNPVTDGIDFVTVQSTQTLAPGLINLGLFTNAARNVLPPVAGPTGDVVRSRDWLWAQDFDIGYGLNERLDVGLNVSYLVHQSTDRDLPGAQFSGVGLNELRANAKYRLFDRRPVGLALIASVNSNETINNPFLGERPGNTWNLELASDVEWGHHIFAFNLGHRFRRSGPVRTDSLYQPLADQSIASLAYSHYFPSWDLKVISEIFAAHQKSNLPPQTPRTSAEILVGLKYDWSTRTSLQGGVSASLLKGLFVPDTRFYVGLNYTFEAFKQPVPTTPAAEKPVSTSVTEMTIYRGYQPQEVLRLEKTPFDEIASRHEFQLTQTLSEDPAADSKAPFQIIRLSGLDFEFGSSKILPLHHGLLNRLVKNLNSEPPVIKVRVEGHTDSVGSEERNRSRSQGRAEAVQAYLREHGLNPKIPVEAIGYGSSKPIADNGNFQGRRQNRRVEVRVLRNIVDAPAERIIKKEEARPK
ncbi:MAG: OmpA family protein [Bdellovibrionaceae bacterium]|nr:OmpA family protein [Pseudobdellovibrionaceae bacterium]